MEYHTINVIPTAHACIAKENLTDITAPCCINFFISTVEMWFFDNTTRY